MIPGRRTAEGQLVITAGPPLSTDPRMAGFALKPTGEIYASGGQSAFTPADLFLNGELGAWYDPSDLTTMFQDRAGTTPVTADGQPVGKILDKSGRGNHASQATAAARPLYKTDGTYHWLQFDGVDDSLSTEVIDFTATDKMSVFGGFRKDGTSTWLELVEFGNSDNNVGAFGVNAPAGAINGVTLYSHGATAISNSAVSSGLAPPIKLVLSSLQNLAGATVDQCVSTRFNASIVGVGNGFPSGGGTFGVFPLFVGSRGGVTARFLGNIYSIIIRGALSTTEEITETETWVNGKTGAY